MTQIISHRGYSAKYPENTMIAFQKAVELEPMGLNWMSSCLKMVKL